MLRQLFKRPGLFALCALALCLLPGVRAAGKTTTVEFWYYEHTDVFCNALQAAVDGFNAQSTGIHEKGSQLFQRLDAYLPPSLFKALGETQFPGPLTDVVFNSGWYGIPFRSDTRGLYMNSAQPRPSSFLFFPRGDLLIGSLSEML